VGFPCWDIHVELSRCKARPMGSWYGKPRSFYPALKRQAFSCNGYIDGNRVVFGSMGRARVLFAGRSIEFVDRDLAIKQVEELAEKGTWVVHVIYGPEGCGKTAFFKQASEILREHGYAVVHINPLADVLEERFSVAGELKELVREVGAYLAGDVWKLIEKAVELLYTSIKKGLSKRIALLADDVFQAIGLDRAEQLVKSLLNMIEWPSVRYERIVVLVASSEGVTAGRVGRHRWAVLRTLWNMGREGFKQLYEILPDPKPEFEEVWRWTGGNPKALESIYAAGWSAKAVVEDMIKGRKLHTLASLGDVERDVLAEAIIDPDALLRRSREAPSLPDLLIEKNLIIDTGPRNPHLWIDTPPPERDPGLGIGRYYAWQTPLHREAVKRVLEAL